MNYTKITKLYKEESLLALKKFLAIPSLYDEKTISETNPYGSNIGEALNFLAELGARYGFNVDKCDGRLVELTYGDGDKLIDIFAHVDVVPATGDWQSDPFVPTIERNVLYARGASDDKGPLIAAFYAIKALKDNGLIRNYRVRLVAGGDEERGSTCLQYYFDTLKKEYPTYGFTPDSDFPLIYGEKGIINFDCIKEFVSKDVVAISGGVVYNAVIDCATFKVRKVDGLIKYLDSKEAKYTIDGDSGNDFVTITFIGKSAHGSTPNKGKNAALIGLDLLGEFFDIPEFKKIVLLLKSADGKPFDGFAKSKELKATTYCLGKISYDGKLLKLGINLRYPENATSASLIEKFRQSFGGEIICGEDSLPLLMNPRSKMIKTLLKAYRKETDDLLSRPFTIGGGTYAKHAKNTVAFGATFPGRDNHIHEPNEILYLKDFYLMQAIYARVIHMLGNLHEN